MHYIAIYTDIGHDCDDIYALIQSLHDHKYGRVSIIFIATTAGATYERAMLVQYICWKFDIYDIPIIPLDRQKATVDGKAIDRCVRLWDWKKEGAQYIHCPQSLNDIYGIDSICPILEGSSIDHVRTILDQTFKLYQHRGWGACPKVSMLIIGPGIEPEPFVDWGYNFHSIVWQGYPDDYDSKIGSFNMKCDVEAAQTVQDYWRKHHIPQYFIGKLTAYATCFTSEQFTELMLSIRPDGDEVPGEFLHKATQLGVMEFRDDARRIFNMLNKQDEPIGSLPSTDCDWFDAMGKKTPMYDLTAYYVVRDAIGCDHPLYHITQSVDMTEDGQITGLPYDYHIGSKSDDGIKHKDTYMEYVFTSTKEALTTIDYEIVRKQTMSTYRSILKTSIVVIAIGVVMYYKFH